MKQTKQNKCGKNIQLFTTIENNMTVENPTNSQIIHICFNRFLVCLPLNSVQFVATLPFYKQTKRAEHEVTQSDR